MTAADHCILDDPDARSRLDPGGMLAAVHALPEQCREAWAATKALKVLWDEPPDRIVILGMGGSAIAGDYFRALLSRETAVLVFNIRQYDLPPFVDERTLVIASSFSGDTEETLSAFEQALATPARKLVITTGGRLLVTARANGVPAFTFAYAGEPRAAIGWGLMPLLAVAEKLGLMQGIERDIDEAVGVLTPHRDEWAADVPMARNPAKQLAVGLHERLPVIYAAGPLIEVASRWKTQLNESAKTWAFCEEMPEAQHNAIVGLGLPKVISRTVTAVLLRSNRLEHPRVGTRYDFSKRLFADAGNETFEATARGESALAQMLSLTQLGDYGAAYLALLYGVDPAPTAVIDELKAWLGERV
jgi:glucose/mannose-6-phosphate isomerase